MYVSKRLGTKWTHHAHNEFCQEIHVKTARSGTIRIFNIYNECGTTNTVDLLHQIFMNSRDHVMRQAI